MRRVAAHSQQWTAARTSGNCDDKLANSWGDVLQIWDEMRDLAFQAVSRTACLPARGADSRGRKNGAASPVTTIRGQYKSLSTHYDSFLTCDWKRPAIWGSEPVFRKVWHLDFLLAELTDHKLKLFLVQFFAALKTVRLKMSQERFSSGAYSWQGQECCGLFSAKILLLGKNNNSKPFPLLTSTEYFTLKMLWFVTDFPCISMPATVLRVYPIFKKNI